MIKAVCFSGVEQVSYRELGNLQIVSDDDAIVRVTTAGLCGSHSQLGGQSDRTCQCKLVDERTYSRCSSGSLARSAKFFRRFFHDFCL